MSDDSGEGAFTTVTRGVSPSQAQKYQTRAVSFGALLTDNGMGEKVVENAEVQRTTMPMPRPKAKKSVGAKQGPAKKIAKKKDKTQDQALEEAFQEREAQLQLQADEATRVEQQQEAETAAIQLREERTLEETQREVEGARQIEGRQREMERDEMTARHEEEIREWREENALLLERLRRATKSLKRKFPRGEESSSQPKNTKVCSSTAIEPTGAIEMKKRKKTLLTLVLFCLGADIEDSNPNILAAVNAGFYRWIYSSGQGHQAITGEDASRSIQILATLFKCRISCTFREKQKMKIFTYPKQDLSTSTNLKTIWIASEDDGCFTATCTGECSPIAMEDSGRAIVDFFFPSVFWNRSTTIISFNFYRRRSNNFGNKVTKIKIRWRNTARIAVEVITL